MIAAPSSRTMITSISLIVIVGLIHLFLSPEYFEFATYLGLLFVANFLGATAAALGIYRGTSWGWPLGILVAGGAFIMYVISRVLGLPGLPESEMEWFDPPGVLSLIVEALLVALYLRGDAQTARERGRGL